MHSRMLWIISGILLKMNNPFYEVPENNDVKENIFIDAYGIKYERKLGNLVVERLRKITWGSKWSFEYV